MDVSLYQAAAAMNATERWQELISNNLATASIPGGRKGEMTFSAVEAGLANTAAGSTNPGYVIPAATSSVNFEQGEVNPSGNAMDFALEGPGFFSIQLPGGQAAYTRNGQFQLNSKGQLVTNQGNLVLGNGGPIQLDPNNPSAITISATGEVSQGMDQKGALKLTDFNQPSQLTSIGGGMYEADNTTLQATPSTTTHVRQGYTEASNTSPTNEMATLITAERMFDANAKVMQMQSDRMSKEITDLGNPS